MEKQTCKALYVWSHGPPDVMQFGDLEVEAPGHAEVTVRVRAFGLNFADVYARMGLYEAAPPPPFVPGFEYAGTIEKLGPGVTDLAEGDAVFGITRFGAYAELVKVPRGYVRRLPAGATFEEGAALLCVYLTAYHGLHTLGHLRDGQRVLIHAAAGGVGTAAIHLARQKDVTIFATAGSEEKLELVRNLGAHLAINYRKDDFESVIRERTGGEGVDLVLDSVGGSVFRKSYRLLAKMGHLVALGAAVFMPSSSSPRWISLIWHYLTRPRIDPLAMIGENRTVSGFNLVHLFDMRDYLKLAFDDLESMWREQKIVPVIGRVYSWTHAAEAHEALRSRETTGKVILTID